MREVEVPPPNSKNFLPKDEILYKLRINRERYHKYKMRVDFQFRPLRLPFPSAGPVHQITLGDAQKCCNKSAAIYAMGSVAAWHLYSNIYPRWFQGHRTEVEFGRFLAKFVRLDHDEKTPATPATALKIVELHNNLCRQINARKQMFERGFDQHDYSLCGLAPLDIRQHRCYLLQPLFRAVIIIAYEGKDYRFCYDCEDTAVKAFLVRTGKTAGLSGPITFESIRMEVEGYEGLDTKVVRTTLRTAVTFLLELEKREVDAYGINPDPAILDEHVFNDIASSKYMGWTGEDVKGPSSSWIDDTKEAT